MAASTPPTNALRLNHRVAQSAKTTQAVAVPTGVMPTATPGGAQMTTLAEDPYYVEGQRGSSGTSDPVEGGISADACASAETLAIPSTTMANLTSTVTDTTDPVYPCRFGGAAQGVGTVWYKFVAPANGNVTVQTCNSTGSATDSILAIFSGPNCPAQSAVPVQCNDDACGPASAPFLSRIDATGLTPGATYYIELSAYEQAARGTYTLEISSPTGPCVSCQTGDRQEGGNGTVGEPNCGSPTDTVNGGCNSTPNVFGPTLTNGQTVCGTSRAGSGSRDTDWFKVTVPANTQITWTATATFGVLVGVVETNGVDSCSGVTAFRVAAVGAACTATSVTTCVPGGTYYLFVAPSSFTTVVNCGATYRATLTTASCATGACCDSTPGGNPVCTNSTQVDCMNSGGVWYGEGTTCSQVTCPDVDCPPGSVDESEPNCGLPTDVTNGGCNAQGEVTFINCDDFVCGTVGTNGSTRDTDWYFLPFSTAGTITVDAIAEFPINVFIVQPGPIGNECGANAVVAFAQGAPGQEVILASDCLTVPETQNYWIVITPQAFDRIGCGARYFFNVLCGSCATGACCLPDGTCAGPVSLADCVDQGGFYIGDDLACSDVVCCESPCTGSEIPEGEVDCGIPDDTTNGGCNSTPAVFTDIECDSTVCGTLAALGGTRDTDWYQITLAEPTMVDWRVTSQVDVLIGIINTGGNPVCTPDTGFLYADLVPACVTSDVTACLPAGTWWLFVSATVFDGISCGAAYTGQVLCSECPVCTTCSGTAEGEPDCTTDYDDQFNGGCAGTAPYEFSPISCGSTVCGTAGDFTNGGFLFRDTDWYDLNLASGGDVTITLNAQFQSAVLLFAADPGADPCGAGLTFIDEADGVQCGDATITATGLAAGRYFVTVIPFVFIGVPCGTTYRLSVNCGAACVNGDSNCDGVVDNSDIDCFVQALLDPTGAAWQACALAVNPNCTYDFVCANDANHDGTVDNSDIDCFVGALLGNPCP